jgi:tyrosine-protein kinase Etk/Wzc
MSNSKKIGTPNFDGSSEEFDVVELLDVIRENLKLIFTIVAIFFSVGLLYAFLAKPYYESDIMVNVEDTPDIAAGKDILGSMSSLFDVKSVAAGEAQIISSRLIVGQTVDNLLLDVAANPKRFPIFGDFISRHNEGLSKPGIFGFGGFLWGTESISVSQFDVPKEYEGDIFTITVLKDGHYRLYGNDLDRGYIGTVGKVNVIDSEAGPILIDIRRVNSNAGGQFELRRDSREGTIDYYQKKLDVEETVKQSGIVIATLRDHSPVKVAQILNDIGIFYVKQNVERKAADAAQSLKFLVSQLPASRGALEDSLKRNAQFRAQKGVVDLDEEAKVVLNESEDLQSKLLVLKQQKADLSSRFGDEHPAIRALNQQIDELENQQNQINNGLQRMPAVQQEAVRLALDVQINTDLYTSLVNNIQQLELVRAGKIGSVRLIDTAGIPDEPVAPKKPIVVIGITFLGLAVGFFVALARNFLFRGITDPAVLEDEFGLNVYATIPYSERQRKLDRAFEVRREKRQILALIEPNEPAIESLRSFRASLRFTLMDARNNIILITGPAPGVGKSFVSVNCATVLASSGKRILLVDCDIRKGYLHQYFGVPRNRGLSDVLSTKLTLDNVLHQNVIDGVDFISTGDFPENPAELLSGEGLKTLLQEASNSYDFILVDTPPILSAADTMSVAPYSGSVFLVTYYGNTRVGEIFESRKRLEQNGVALTGVIFNGMNPNFGRYGYKYGGYRYEQYSYKPGD